MSQLIIHTDGGARGNPGPAACAFVVQDTQDQLLYQAGDYLGKTTNNVAEYSAVSAALSWLQTNLSVLPQSDSAILFKLDSLLVVNQLTGLYKIKNASLLTLFTKIKSQESQLKLSFSYHHVPRAQNKLADALVNEVLDRHLNRYPQR